MTDWVPPLSDADKALLDGLKPWLGCGAALADAIAGFDVDRTIACIAYLVKGEHRLLERDRAGRFGPMHDAIVRVSARVAELAGSTNLTR